MDSGPKYQETGISVSYTTATERAFDCTASATDEEIARNNEKIASMEKDMKECEAKYPLFLVNLKKIIK